MKVDYSGKTVVITGGAGAIGSAMAEAFAANGAKVAVCGRNVAKGQEVADKIKAAGGIAEAFKLDVTDRNQVPECAAAIEKAFGTIDVLINNAGVNVGPDDRGPIHEFKEDKWDWIRSVDLDGVYNCAKVFIPYLKKTGAGNIINISSIVGVVPLRNQCAFAACKAAVVNLTKAMAIELAPENIRVNVIAPGSILFEGTKALFYADKEKAEKMLVNIPQHRAGSGEDISNAALYLGSDADASYVTGATLVVDGGWTCGFARDF